MDNRRERKTSGESTASDSSETASCRPNYLLETPAAFPSSQVVRSATPSTWYAPCSSSASRVCGDSQSPADLMDSPKSNQVTIIMYYYLRHIIYPVFLFDVYFDLISCRGAVKRHMS